MIKRIKKICVVACFICIAFGTKCLADTGDNAFVYDYEDKDASAVKEQVDNIIYAVKNMDFKKVVDLSDYNGTYDTKYIDEFFSKYEGSKDIVKKLFDVFDAHKENITKISSSKNKSDYKVRLNICIVDIDKLIKKILPKVGLDIFFSKFNKNNLNNDIINIILKRINEQIEKESVDTINFVYDVVWTYSDKKNQYVIKSESIIKDVYDKLKPMLDTLNVNINI